MQVKVLGAERRRRWSYDEKVRLIEETCTHTSQKGACATELLPSNFFVIGVVDHKYRISIMPIAYLDKFLPEIQRHFEQAGVVKFAEGELNPRRMTFHTCFLDRALVRRILRDAFLSRRVEQRLEEFLQAEVFIEDQSLNCTIASLLTPEQSFH